MGFVDVMRVVGFIGFIGMGKLMVVVMLCDLGVLVFDVDVVVYEL